jgi:hypothetical protein
MTGTQLSFTLRTSTNVKTVHLLGSWDNYAGQLPMSRDGKAGAWKGHFRFQSSTLAPGQRYWYYYIMDGYHVSHDPAKPSTVEPTTGRKLNILDAPKAKAGAAPEVPQGRGLSPSRIVHPKPSKPYASRAVREADYSMSPVDDLTGQLEQASLYHYSASPPSSVGSSLSSRSSGGSSPASLSSLSDSSGSSRCSCERYGITRSGSKVLIDCGGRRCGYSDDSSSGCSSGDSSSEIDSSSESEDEAPRRPVKQAAPSKSASKPASKSKPSAAPATARRAAATTTSRRR